MFEKYDDILTVEEVMEILFIGKNKAYDLLRNGVICGFKVGNVWRVPRISLNDFISSQCKQT